RSTTATGMADESPNRLALLSPSVTLNCMSRRDFLLQLMVFRPRKRDLMLFSMLSLNRKFLAGVVATIVTFSPFAFSQTSEKVAQVNPIDRQLNMLVLGDSILWGEGLKTEHKSWYQVKTWLATNTSGVVIERIEAHAGAVIEGSDATENMIAQDGEVNVALPTVSEQADRALRYYKDGSKVDLVLVNGCANDIGAQ